MSAVIAITGAASGIGRALAEQHLQRGDRVALLDINLSALQEFRDQSPANERILPLQIDVSNEEQIQHCARSIRERWGRVDVWYNNAGIAQLGSFGAVSSAEFARVIAVNFLGVVYGTRAALSVMREPEHGTIVNIASINGRVAAPFMSSYVAAKHAVVGFTRSLQIEKSQMQSPIRIVLVCPGWVKTPIMASRSGFEFPNWLDWVVDSPEKAAQEILQGVDAGKSEITPTWNGKMLRFAHGMLPSLVEGSTRLLTARTWKEIIGLSKIRR